MSRIALSRIVLISITLLSCKSVHRGDGGDGSASAACINYPTSGYRLFPYDPSIKTGRNSPKCTLNCTAVTPSYGPVGLPPLDQALPYGPCDDEGATCDSPVMTGWCAPCADVGGPGNAYTCLCRGHNWHCAVTSYGASTCGPPTCIDPSQTGNIMTDTCHKYQTTWSDTQVCVCGVCRDLCDSDTQCPSGRCKLNQVCRPSSDTCNGPDECPAPCRGVCEPASDAGVPSTDTDAKGALAALVFDVTSQSISRLARSLAYSTAS
jgi:hypothetical protein